MRMNVWIEAHDKPSAYIQPTESETSDFFNSPRRTKARSRRHAGRRPNRQSQSQQHGGHHDTMLRRISLCLKPLTKLFDDLQFGASITLKTVFLQSNQWHSL